MRSHIYVFVICLSVAMAFPYDSFWSAAKKINREPSKEIRQSKFNSMLRSLIRRKLKLEEPRQSSPIRGIGFAGLDNMDVITTTLDRARKRADERMSSHVAIAKLLRLAHAG